MLVGIWGAVPSLLFGSDTNIVDARADVIRGKIVSCVVMRTSTINGGSITEQEGIMRRSHHWTKERSLWWLQEAHRKGRIVMRIWPYMVLVGTTMIVGLWFWMISIKDLQELSTWEISVGWALSNPGVWLIFTSQLSWILTGVRGDWFFLRRYKRWKRRFPLDPEVAAEAERIYNDFRKMSVIWLPPRKLPDQDRDAVVQRS